MLLIIYLVFFRADGGTLKSALKILKGLNSNTFNYLESNKEALLVGKDIPKFTKNADGSA